VANVDLPTGYAFYAEGMEVVKDEQVAAKSNIKNIESKNHGTRGIVYYDYLTVRDTCLDLPVSRLYTVVTKNKASITVFEYSNPNHKGAILYDPAVKKTICQLCLETKECDLVRCGDIDRRRRRSVGGNETLTFPFSPSSPLLTQL